MKKDKLKRTKRSKKSMSRAYVIFGVIALLVLCFGIILFKQLVLHQSVLGATYQNLIQEENAKTGTTSWQITKPAQSQIQAYVGEDSVLPGGHINLYVSTTSRSYTITIYRLGYYRGKGGRLLETISNLPGVSQGYYINGRSGPTNCPTCVIQKETEMVGANWHASRHIPVPKDWVTGILLIKLTTKEGYQWQVPLVLRPLPTAPHADFIFADPLETDEAYNVWGGADFYKDFIHPAHKRAYALTLNRPFTQDYGAGHLFFWTYSTLRFLEEHGYNVAYTTDMAITYDGDALTNYKVYVSPGHDEYWSAPQRDALETALTSGVNAAFFGANDIYWQTRLASDPIDKNNDWSHRVIICYKDAKLDLITSIDPKTNLSLKTVRWRDEPVNDPEDRILGSMYGSLNATKFQDMYLTFANNPSWIFNNITHSTNVIPHIVGNEIDSVFHDVPPQDKLYILSNSPYVDEYGYTLRQHTTLDIKQNGAMVFNAATIFYPLALTDFKSHYEKTGNIEESKVLRQLTKNILDRMLLPLLYNQPSETPTPATTYVKNEPLPNATQDIE